MKAKAVVRDVGRVLEMPFADVDKVAKQIPADARHDARQGARGERRRSRSWSRTIRRSRSCSRVARRLEGHDPPRLGARRRRRHRAEGDHRIRAALQGGARRNHDPVVDEGDRADRPPEDGLPRPEHADADRRRDRGDQADDRRRRSTSTRAARRCEDLSDLPGRADLRHLPVREQRHARHSAQGQAAAARGSDRAERALPPRPAAQRDGRRLHRAQAGQDRGQVRAAGSSSRFSPRPTASSPTRNR